MFIVFVFVALSPAYTLLQPSAPSTVLHYQYLQIQFAFFSVQAALFLELAGPGTHCSLHLGMSSPKVASFSLSSHSGSLVLSHLESPNSSHFLLSELPCAGTETVYPNAFGKYYYFSMLKTFLHLISLYASDPTSIASNRPIIPCVTCPHVLSH